MPPKSPTDPGGTAAAAAQATLGRALPGWAPGGLAAFFCEMDADNSDFVDRAELLRFLRAGA